jgi:hypothetical protein
MSRITLVGVAAILGLTALAGCQRAPAAQQPVTPIYAEPITGKTR